MKRTGSVNGFIHAAGIRQTLPFKVMKPDTYLNHFNVNVVSGFEIARILAKRKYRDEPRPTKRNSCLITSMHDKQEASHARTIGITVRQHQLRALRPPGFPSYPE